MNFIPLGVTPGLAVASTARARRLRSFALVAFCRRFIRSKLALPASSGQRDRRMARDQFERPFGQFAARENLVPRRCAGGMGQGNQIETVSCAFGAKLMPNYFVEFCAVDELHDGQSADWNDKARP